MRIRPPRGDDETAFLAAVERSVDLHADWVSPPRTAAGYRGFVERLDGDRQASFLVLVGADLGGVVNLSEIVRGCFLSAYLGYYALVPWAGRGVMSRGLSLVIATAFDELGLHRLEANIQPENTASLELVRRLGFRKEGFSPRYLKIAGRWADHERWALLVEDWPRP